MATYDHSPNGCSCGLKRKEDCDCETSIPKPNIQNLESRVSKLEKDNLEIIKLLKNFHEDAKLSMRFSISTDDRLNKLESIFGVLGK